MENTMIKKLSSVVLAGILFVTAATGTFAMNVSASEADVSAAEAAETESEELSTEAEEIAEQEFTVEIGADAETKTIVNKTDVSIAEVTYEINADTPTDTAQNEEVQEEQSNGVLLINEEGGAVHTFEDVDLTSASDYSIVEKLSFLFVKGTDSNGEEIWFYETAEDVTLDEPVAMYTVGMVNIREEPDGDSTLLATAERGSEVEVAGGTSKWFLVTQDDVSGYVAARYLTEDEAEAEAAVEAESTARAAAEAAAAAQAAAEAAAAQSYSYSDSYSSSAPTEVGREAIYDCDGSGNGYYEITYSDGSVGYEDF